MSFNNLVEAHVMKALRQHHGASMQEIRNAIRFAEKELGVKRLLLRHELCTIGGELFFEHLAQLINLSRSGQLGMKGLLQQYLKRIVRDDQLAPSRLHPLLSAEVDSDRIVIDPRVAFGRPTIAGSGISTAVVARRVDTGEDVSDVAMDYGISEEAVHDAILYEVIAS